MYTFGIAPHDMVNRNDVNAVPEYVTDMFQRYYELEVRTDSNISLIYSYEILKNW